MKILLLLVSAMIPFNALGSDLSDYINASNGKRATTYGYGEPSCGNTIKPEPCYKGQKTASGVEFDPKVASLALALPIKFRLRPTKILVRLKGGSCKLLWLLDKKNYKMFNSAPWDLSPEAVKVLGGKASRIWSGIIEVCKIPNFGVDPNSIASL